MVLGLQQSWPEMAAADRTAILDLILSSLPKMRVQQQAHRISQLYDQIHQPETPQVIVSLRVSLRKRNSPEHGTETGKEENDTSSASTGETFRESRGAERGAPPRKQPTCAKKRRVEAQRDRERQRAMDTDTEAALRPHVLSVQETRRDETRRDNRGQQPTEQVNQSLELGTQDERQTERWHEMQVQEEYQKQLDDEAAEAEYLASYQAELDITEAEEAYDRAQRTEEAADTCLDGDDDGPEADLRS